MLSSILFFSHHADKSGNEDMFCSFLELGKLQIICSCNIYVTETSSAHVISSCLTKQGLRRSLEYNAYLIEFLRNEIESERNTGGVTEFIEVQYGIQAIWWHSLFQKCGQHEALKTAPNVGALVLLFFSFFFAVNQIFCSLERKVAGKTCRMVKSAEGLRQFQTLAVLVVISSCCFK